MPLRMKIGWHPIVQRDFVPVNHAARCLHSATTKRRQRFFHRFSNNMCECSLQATCHRPMVPLAGMHDSNAQKAATSAQQERAQMSGGVIHDRWWLEARTREGAHQGRNVKPILVEPSAAATVYIQQSHPLSCTGSEMDRRRMLQALVRKHGRTMPCSRILLAHRGRMDSFHGDSSDQ